MINWKNKLNISQFSSRGKGFWRETQTTTWSSKCPNKYAISCNAHFLKYHLPWIAMAQQQYQRKQSSILNRRSRMSHLFLLLNYYLSTIKLKTWVSDKRWYGHHYFSLMIYVVILHNLPPPFDPNGGALFSFPFIWPS